MGREIVFSSDYIEVLTTNYDLIIYTPVYSEKVGLYLSSEDEKPIKDIRLFNSKLIINYLDGKKRLIDDSVISITIEDNHFQRRMNESISGTLFKYSINDAQFYELETEKAYDYAKSNIRKRSV